MNNFASLALLKRNALLAWRNPWDILLVLFFFIGSGTLFPLSVNEHFEWLGDLAGGIGMSLAMLSALLSMERLFLPDAEDGTLALISLSSFSLFSHALSTALSHWLSIILPLLLIMPLLGLLLGVPVAHLWLLPFFAMLATPALSLLGTFGAALTLGTRRAGLLLIVIILPLFVPFLIFSSLGIAAGQKGEPIETYILLLIALDLIALASLPWATFYALKDAVRS